MCSSRSIISLAVGPFQNIVSGLLGTARIPTLRLSPRLHIFKFCFHEIYLKFSLANAFPHLLQALMEYQVTYISGVLSFSGALSQLSSRRSIEVLLQLLLKDQV